MSQRPHFFKDPHKISGMEPSEPILVALSGGADSSALLHLLCDYAKDAECRIVAAHLNHSIRGENYANEADRDEEFCRSLCASLGVRLFVRRLDIPALSRKSGRSLEEEARVARYEFFDEIMAREGIKLLATAHNSNDNLETQIFNLCRGCGIEGLVGIPEKRPLKKSGEALVLRPILSAEKREIIEYCADNGIEYVTDSTNFVDDCTRNAIRLRVIPELDSIFPTAKRSAQRLAASAAEDADFINECAKSFISSHPYPILASDLLSLHQAQRKRVLALMFSSHSGATLESVHICALSSLLENKKNGASLSLPDGIKAQLQDGHLVFLADTRKKAPAREQYTKSLNTGFNGIENTPFVILRTDKEEKTEKLTLLGKSYSLYSSAALNIAPSSPLCIKNRTEGATILDGGKHKSIKKLMCDKKVPLNDRDTVPLIYSSDNAIYVPLCAIADDAKPRKKENLTYIYLYKSEDQNA